MSYRVKDYMMREVNTITSDATVTEAAKLMASDKQFMGYVIILEQGRPIGMLTERDIINKVIAKGLNPSKTPVSEIMSKPLVTVDPDDDLLNASRVMSERNVRKLVVIRGEIIYGILTAKVIAMRCGEYLDRSVKDIIRWSAPIGI